MTLFEVLEVQNSRLMYHINSHEGNAPTSFANLIKSFPCKYQMVIRHAFSCDGFDLPVLIHYCYSVFLSWPNYCRASTPHSFFAQGGHVPFVIQIASAKSQWPVSVASNRRSRDSRKRNRSSQTSSSLLLRLPPVRHLQAA